MPEEPLSDPVVALTAATTPKLDIQQLLPHPTVPGLTEHEIVEVAAYQQALAILGPAAGSVMMCPGMQVGLAVHQRCPHYDKCPLIRLGKAQADTLCWMEKDYMEKKFYAWSRQLERETDELTEVERATVSELTWLDIQEMRCVNILSTGSAARMHQKNVKEVHPETGEHLSWEWVIHVNAELLDRIQTQRRMILKDWELTPEMKTRKAKIEGKNRGTDQSSLQSARADKLRRLAPVVEG